MKGVSRVLLNLALIGKGVKEGSWGSGWRPLNPERRAIVVLLLNGVGVSGNGSKATSLGHEQLVFG